VHERLRYVHLDEDFGCYTPEHRPGEFGEIGFSYAEIFREDRYLRYGITLPPGAVVVDAGANVGLFTLRVKAQRPDARVVAIEPMPDTFRALRANLEHHGHDDVLAYELALGAAREREVPFTFHRDLPGNSTRYPEHQARTQAVLPASAYRVLTDTREIPVPVERLSDVLAGSGLPPRIDLMKIHVQDAELDVLRGIDAADWARVRQLVIAVSGLEEEPALIEKILHDNGFLVQRELTGAEPATGTLYAHRPGE
jgi:FkbM family methyltransferase